MCWSRRVRFCASILLFAAAMLIGGCGSDPTRVYGYTRVSGEDTELPTGSYRSGMTRAREEAIIASAIAAHETRHP
jgi:hypothetical protein